MRILVGLLGVISSFTYTAIYIALSLLRRRKISYTDYYVAGKFGKRLRLKQVLINGVALNSMSKFIHYMLCNYDIVGPAPLPYESIDALNSEQKKRLHVAPGLISPLTIKQWSGVAYSSEQQIAEAFILDDSCKRRAEIFMVWLMQKVVSLFSGIRKHKSLATPEQFELFNVTIANIKMDQAINEITHGTGQNKNSAGPSTYAFVNADCVNQFYKNQDYQDTLNNFDKVFADGIGVKIAAKWQGIGIVENVNGTDMFPLICKRFEAEGKSLYLHGATIKVIEMLVSNLARDYPKLKVVGFSDGYSYSYKNNKLIEKINKSKPDLLLIAMGGYRQEKWIADNLDQLEVGAAMGVGGLFDFYSGAVSRAPQWVRELSLEWVWRLIQQPKDKAKRYLIGNPLFLVRARFFQVVDHVKSASDYLTKKTPLKLKRIRMKPTTIGYMRYKLWKMKAPLCRRLKRVMDVFLASCGVIVLSPLLLFVIIAIKLESKGSFLFKQIRVGIRGETFLMWKFRSMVVDAEEIKKSLLSQNENSNDILFKMKKDPRITRVGKFIRKTSIDELPQLFNVIKGDMSIVGPRPPVPSEVAQYKPFDRQRLEVLPGITGLWQVSGRSDIPFDQQVLLDIEYMKNQSIIYDAKLIAKTIPAILTARGAY